MPTPLVAHLQFHTSQHTSQKLQKSHQTNAPRQTLNETTKHDRKRRAKA